MEVSVEEKEAPQEKRSPIRQRKKRGSGSRKIGPKRKQHYQGESSAASTSTVTSETDSSYLATDATDSQIEYEVNDEFRCGLSFDDQHVCLESDDFSETASEFYVETESEEVISLSTECPDESRRKRRKRKLHLARHRKGATTSKGISKNIDDEDELIDVETSDIEEIIANIPADSKSADGAAKSSSVESNVTTATCADTQQGDVSVPMDLDAAVIQLRDNLKLLLPDFWCVDVVRNEIVRVVNLTSSKNARVEMCLYYEIKRAAIGLFIHGACVPADHKIFKPKTLLDWDNIGSVSHYLSELASKLVSTKLCTGINKYQELWRKYDGYTDNISSEDKEECFRRSDCLLLIEEKQSICRHCQSLLNIFEREIKKREKGRENPINIPDKFKTKEELKEQKEHFRKLYRKEKQRSKRLERRVDLLQVKLDQAMKDDLISILRNNVDKMSPLQRLFWESQMQALTVSNKRGLRWHPMMIRLALHFHSLSPAAYEYMQETKVLVLPSKRRLYDYSHFIDAEEGCSEEIICDIKKKIDSCGPEHHFSYVNVMFDEMHIRSGLVTKRSTGQLIGFTKLQDVEEDLKQLQHEFDLKTYKPKLAKKVLVYMAQGITSPVKDVVAVFSTDELSAVQLHDRTWDVIYHLEDAEIKVLSLTCDGASTNRKFIRMHQSYNKSSKFVYCTKNLAAGDLRPLYFIVDPPHLLKTVRNALANSFSHRKSRRLWKNGEFLSWKVIELLYELTKHNKFRSHKLTKAHIKLSSFSCMTVSFATQALSKSVADSIEQFSNHESMESFDTCELVKFIRIMNRFFDCVNGKQEVESDKLSNTDLASYSDANDERLHFLEDTFLNYFEDWKKDILERPGIFTDTERSRAIISHQALEALQVTVHGIVGSIRFMLNDVQAPFVNARVFNQDPLEQYFSIVRRKQGDNRQPTLKAMLDTRLNIHAGGHAALPSSSGNTLVEKRKDLPIDETRLPSRKVPRKSSN